VKRWIYTPRGVRKLTQSANFPPPTFTINAGRTKVWHMADIRAFEARHPEVTSEDAKRRKVVGFALAVAKGNKEQAA
jgi:hypothetical protein